MRITIAIITYQRAESLQKTLASIGKLLVPEDADIGVLIVDNDKAQSALPIVEGLSGFPFALRYMCQPQKGRGYARNSVLDATEHDDYLVCFDDDIEMAPDWLIVILDCIKKNEAQFCAGHLRYLFTQDVPNWVHSCRLFQSKVTGIGAPLISTSHSIMDRQWVRSQALRFPLGIATEDLFFTHVAQRKGARIITCENAHSTTCVEADRVNVAWVLRRAMRNGANRSAIQRQLYGPRAAIVFSCYRAAQMFYFAAGSTILACIRQRSWIRPIEHGGMGLGYLAGMVGIRSVITFNS